MPLATPKSELILGLELGTWVTALLVILGWVLVHYLTTVRERRKEVGEAVREIVSRLRDIEGLAVEFHSAPQFDSQRARNILTELGRLAGDLSLPQLKPFATARAMKRFRQSITYRNFDMSQFQSQPAASRILGAIADSSDSLAAELKSAYHVRYFKHWWQCFRV